MTRTKMSARISPETKEQIEWYSRAHGVNQSALVEQALLHHLRALRDLPAEFVVPPRLRLTAKSFAEVQRLAASPRKPTRALRTLLARIAK